MPPEVCSEHQKLSNDIAVVKNDVQYIRTYIDKQDTRISTHIHEGEKPGGVRERLTIAEQEIKTIRDEKLNSTKASQWRIGLIVAVGMSVVNIIARIWIR